MGAVLQLGFMNRASREIEEISADREGGNKFWVSAAILGDAER